MKEFPPSPPRKTIVVVGLMGAGKTSIGRRLAHRLGVPFVEADAEIVKAAGCSVEDIFELYGEEAFRDCERKVIARLLDGDPCVLATGGGAFTDAQTRERTAERGISVWLRAGLDLLVERTGRRRSRPLLNIGDARETLARLMEERHPIYATADITVDTGTEHHDVTVENVLRSLADLQSAGEGGRAE